MLNSVGSGTGGSSERQDSIDSRHPEYEDAYDDMKLISTLLGGPTAMRDQGVDYLPELSGETPVEYSKRLSNTYLHPGFTEGVQKQTSKPFSQRIVVEGREKLNKPIQASIDDMDGNGTSLDQMAEAAFFSGASYGSVYLFTDYSSIDLPPGASRKDEIQLGARPKMSFIEKKDLFNWGFDDDGTLSEIRFYATSVKTVGTFGKERVNLIYRWTKTEWFVYENVKKDEQSDDFLPETGSRSWKLAKSGQHNLGKIPIEIVFFGPQNGRVMGKSPNQELAYTVKEHYQDYSDQKSIVKCSRTGVYFAKGFYENELDNVVLGANSIVESENELADLKVVEYTGSAVAIGRQELDILEKRIDALGMKPVIDRSYGDVTATEVVSNNCNASSDIKSWAIALQNGLMAMLNTASMWQGSELPEGVEVHIYDDYVVEGVSADLPTLLQSASAGLISTELYLREAQRRGVIDSRVNIEDEIKKIEKEKDERAKRELEMHNAMQPVEPNNADDSLQDD